MNHYLRATAVLAAVVLLGSGCGSDDESVTPPPDPGGTGTGTLLVTAKVEGEDEGIGYKTAFTAEVANDSGLPISGATVTMLGPPGTLNLAEVVGSPGSYASGISGYEAGTYRLTVVRGADEVREVRVLAPDRHTVTEPDPGDTVTANAAMTVRWSRLAAAEQVRIETNNYASGVETDDGVATVPAGQNPARDDQVVRVRRRNETTPAGGVTGSRFEAEVRASSQPVIVR
jgi:hypothetical protein